MALSKEDVRRYAAKLVADNPKAEYYEVDLEVYEAIEDMTPAHLRYTSTKLAEEGIENIIPGLFAPTFILKGKS